MPEQAQDFGLYFWSHLVLIVAMWTSPLWLAWPLVAVGVVLYWLQLLVFGNCILTKGQFRTESRTRSFYQHYFEKMGFRVDGPKLIRFLDVYAPCIIFAAAFVVQRYVTWAPLLRW